MQFTGAHRLWFNKEAGKEGWKQLEEKEVTLLLRCWLEG